MKLTEAGLDQKDLIGLRVKRYVDGQFPDGDIIGTIIGTAKKKCEIQWDAENEPATLDNKNIWLLMTKQKIQEYLLEKYCGEESTASAAQVVPPLNNADAKIKSDLPQA